MLKMGWRHAATVIAALQLCFPLLEGLDNGLAARPQMGYNTWNCFQGASVYIVHGTADCCPSATHDHPAAVDEAIVRSTADLMVELGFLKAGYNYLVIDDAWSLRERDEEDGRILADPEKFPSGMKAMADLVHDKGMRFGMYSDAGARTCLGFPGSRGNEEVDAQMFADWGIDFLKYDNCWAPASDWVVDRFAAMRDALNQTARPILYSLCDWGVGDPWLWGPKVGNSWRTTGDISAAFESMLRCLDNTVGLSRFAGPGGWNDPDMLEVGNLGLTHNEQRAHFAIWALIKAPLMVGADLRSISREALDILLNPEIVAINQDALAVAGDLVWKQGPIEAYAGPLQGGDRAVVLFNRHTIGTQYPISNITIAWADLGYGDGVKATVRDLWQHKDLGAFTGSFTGAVDIHDGMALRISPKDPLPEYDKWRPWVWRDQAAAGDLIPLSRRKGAANRKLPQTAIADA